MKFQPEVFGSAITGYGPGWVAVNNERIHHSLILDGATNRRERLPAGAECPDRLRQCPNRFRGRACAISRCAATSRN